MLNAPQFLSRAGARSSLYSRGDALAIVICLASRAVATGGDAVCLCLRDPRSTRTASAHRFANQLFDSFAWRGCSEKLILNSLCREADCHPLYFLSGELETNILLTFQKRLTSEGVNVF